MAKKLPFVVILLHKNSQKVEFKVYINFEWLFHFGINPQPSYIQITLHATNGV